MIDPVSTTRYVITTSGGIAPPLAAHIIRDAVSEAGGEILREDLPLEKRGYLTEMAVVGSAAGVTVIVSGVATSVLEKVMGRLKERGAKAEWREDDAYR